MDWSVLLEVIDVGLGAIALAKIARLAPIVEQLDKRQTSTEEFLSQLEVHPIPEPA